MPYYQYKGINLAGRIKKGRIFAANSDALDLIVLKRDIALISFKIVPMIFVPSITKETVMHFFDRLATLLRSGVLIPDALAILRDSFGHVRMQNVLADVCEHVERGESLHKAMARHAEIFDEHMVQMVFIGQETGSLPITVAAMASYLQTVIEFRAKLKSAAAGPLISFGFFIVIVAIIIVGIIPTMSSVFVSTHQQMPKVTQLFLVINEWVRSWLSLLCIILGLVAGYLGCKALSKQPKIKRWYDTIVLHMPYVRNLVYDTQRAWFFDSLVLLTRGGMPLANALSIACRSCRNSIIYEYLLTVDTGVSLGTSLSHACQQCPGNLFSDEDCAIIAVGENAGQLSFALSDAADASRARAARSITYLTTVLQPLLLVILALLITLLILAIYAPMFTLSWGIT